MLICKFLPVIRYCCLFFFSELLIQVSVFYMINTGTYIFSRPQNPLRYSFSVIFKYKIGNCCKTPHRKKEKNNIFLFLLIHFYSKLFIFQVCNCMVRQVFAALVYDLFWIRIQLRLFNTSGSRKKFRIQKKVPNPTTIILNIFGFFF